MPRALVAAAITVAGLLAVSGRLATTAAAVEQLVIMLGYLVLLAAVVRGLGARGLAFLWLVLLIGWVVLLNGVVTNSNERLSTAAQLLVDPFVTWSLLALPLAMASVVVHRRSKRAPIRRSTLAAGAVYLVILLASAYLARFAPDVGMGPRNNVTVRRVMLLAAPPLPFIASLYFMRLLSRREGAS